MFVGSPVSTEEKEVRALWEYVLCSHVCVCVCVCMHAHVYVCVCACMPTCMCVCVAGETGQEAEEGESQCRHCQLWRRSESTHTIATP